MHRSALKKEVLIMWGHDEALANDILRDLQDSAKYPWARNKIDRARRYLVETRTALPPWDTIKMVDVINGDPRPDLTRISSQIWE